MKPRHYKLKGRESSAGSLSKNQACNEETLRAEIRRLESELRREKLRADLNEEIINVAERKFNIQIRKNLSTTSDLQSARTGYPQKCP